MMYCNGFISQCMILLNINATNSKPKLFFSHKYLNRNTGKFKILPDLILQISFIRFFHILRKITEKGKRRGMRRQLGNIFYFHIFSFYCRRRIIFNNFQHHFIQLQRWEFFASGCYIPPWPSQLPCECAPYSGLK